MKILNAAFAIIMILGLVAPAAAQLAPGTEISLGAGESVHIRAGQDALVKCEDRDPAACSDNQLAYGGSQACDRVRLGQYCQTHNGHIGRCVAKGVVDSGHICGCLKEQ